ncbi:MAG: YoaP domain-containing protein [Bacteroidetes bacterium]|nr:YoaP domain-containing protein [Bacteroidota bacterium]
MYPSVTTDNVQILDLTPDNIADYGVCGYKDIENQVELQRKIAWFGKYYPKGLRIKIIVSEKGGYQGMIEYIPGEFAHRPVDAEGYMFIHCLWVGFRKEYKSRGFASALIDECISDARRCGKHGVSVVTRKGAFMVKKEIFLKKGFRLVDTAEPDFELMVLKFDGKAGEPVFRIIPVDSCNRGLTIYRSAQCPYSVKNVEAILKTAKKLNIEAGLLELDDAEAAQSAPCAFGTFCIVYNGEVISHHPISNTRFGNILKKYG